MVKLALIVPVVGLQADVDSTLVSVLENRPADCQVLVPCPASYQDPYQLEDEVRFVSCPTDDLATLLNAAIEATDAEILQFILPGMSVSADWADAALERFESEPDLAAISPVAVQIEKPERVSALGIRYLRSGRKSYVGQGRKKRSVKPLAIDGPTLHGGFFRREVFAEVGGFNPKFSPHWLDADLAARLNDAELASAVETEACVYASIPAVPCGFRTTAQAERLFWQHASNQGLLGSLFAHLPWVLLDTVSQLPRISSITSLAGRLWGLVQGWALSCTPPDLNLQKVASQQPATIRMSDATKRPTPAELMQAPQETRRRAG